jgi:hypothetical protein
MDDRLDTLMHDIDFGDGRVQVWNADGWAWYEYRVFDASGQELTRSDNGYGSALPCLRDGLNFLMAAGG